MNRNLIIVGVVILVIVAGALFTFGEKGSTQEPTSAEIENTAEDNKEATLEEHMAEQEENTIMAMGGKMTPSVLYVSPGQELTILNHESEDLKIIAEDGSFESDLVAAGTEGANLVAPLAPGRYIYYSSINPEVKGTLVVEE